jgi:hypothetical protein
VVITIEQRERGRAARGACDVAECGRGRNQGECDCSEEKIDAGKGRLMVRITPPPRAKRRDCSGAKRLLRLSVA